MHRYSLRFAPSSEWEGKEVQFEASDPTRALFIAHAEARARSAELWCDGKRLCRIDQAHRETRDFWIIS